MILQKLNMPNFLNFTWHKILVSGVIIESVWSLRVSFAYIESKDKDMSPLIEYKAKKICDEDLIPELPDTYYIVSEKVCRALPHRDDLYTMYWIETDSGKPISAKGIKQNPYFSWN